MGFCYEIGSNYIYIESLNKNVVYYPIMIHWIVTGPLLVRQSYNNFLRYRGWILRLKIPVYTVFDRIKSMVVSSVTMYLNSKSSNKTSVRAYCDFLTPQTCPKFFCVLVRWRYLLTKILGKLWVTFVTYCLKKMDFVFLWPSRNQRKFP